MPAQLLNSSLTQTSLLVRMPLQDIGSLRTRNRRLVILVCLAVARLSGRPQFEDGGLRHLASGAQAKPSCPVLAE